MAMDLIPLGILKGDQGDEGEQGPPGPNTVPTAQAVATALETGPAAGVLATKIAAATIPAMENVPAQGFGHSFLASAPGLNPGAGADVGGHALERVAIRCRTAALQNLAQGNTRSDQILASIIANRTPNTRGVIFLGGGHRNDQNFYTNATPNIATVREVFRSIFAHLTARAIVDWTNSAFQFGPGWTAGVSDGTAGRYVDIAFTGDSVFIPFAAVTGSGGTFTVKDAAGATLATASTGGFGVAFTGVKKVGGLGPGSHTVRLSVTTGVVTINGVIIPAATPPFIVWELEPPYNPAVVSGGALANSVSAAYQAATQTVLSDFDTTRIVVVDSPPAWNPAVDTCPDGVHPSGEGHGKIADHAMARLLEADIDFTQGLNWMVGSAADPTTYTTPAVAYTSPGATAPSAPALTAVADRQILHTWARVNDGGATVTNYELEYSLNGTTGWTSKATYTPGTVTAQIMTGLTPGTTYYARLKATNSVGSTYSNVASAVAGTSVTVYSADSFGRADSASLGATETGGFTWGAVPTTDAYLWTIASNRLLKVAGATTVPRCCVMDDGQADGEFYLTLVSAIASVSGITFRDSGNAAGTGLAAVRNADGTYKIYSRSGGTFTSIYTSPAIAAQGDIAKIVAAGSSLTLVVNGVTIDTITSTVGQTQTKHGAYAGGASVTSFEDWKHTN